MSIRDLLEEAKRLPDRSQGLLCVQVTAVLDPLLDLDGSDEGRDGAATARLLHRQGWEALLAGDARRAAEVEADILSTPDLDPDEEEPDGPAFYRVGFLAALVYGVDAYVSLRFSGTSAWLYRMEDLIDYLEDDLPQALEGVDLVSLTAVAIRVHESAGPDRAAEALEAEVASMADRVRRNLSGTA